MSATTFSACVDEYASRPFEEPDARRPARAVLGSVSRSLSAMRGRVASPFATSSTRRARTWGGIALFAALVAGCGNDAKKSAEFARGHALELASAAKEDVREVRTGLPLGAAELAKILPPKESGEIDAQTAREALQKARNKVQDLRVAKSTFFALVAAGGSVIRNDREQDRMAGKDLFVAYPGIRAALDGKYVETGGSMPEASEVRGRGDAQWVAAAPVRMAGETRALYVTGWSWSAYAYRLENSLRSNLRSALPERGKMPLAYVYVVVDREVYGAPISPEVNAKAIKDQAVLQKLKGTEPWSVELELTGRAFGLGVALAPELGDKIAIAVLRSET
jgi:hypothetical protein